VAISRLEAMLGEPVRQAITRPAHVLEERFSYDAFKPPKVSMLLPPCHPELVEGRQKNDAAIVPQLRLLAVSEIDVTVRNGAPAAVSVRNARPPRAVLECSGPWRVEVGWFSDTCVVRDEYDVLLEDGELFRIYRQGSQWYLRGSYD
jgi:hypothetical protein